MPVPVMSWKPSTARNDNTKSYYNMNMKKKKALLTSFFASALIFLGGCGSEPYAETTCIAMDTQFSLKIYGTDEDVSIQQTEMLSLLSALLDCHIENSGISLLNQTGFLTDDTGTITDILTQTQALQEEFGNAVQLSCRPLTALWNIGNDAARVPSDAEIQEVLPQIDDFQISFFDNTVAIPTYCELDFGAVAKGYALDQLAEEFRKSETPCAVADAASAVLFYGQKPTGQPFSLGISDPASNGMLGTLTISNADPLDAVFISTSANTERFLEADGTIYGHIFDLQTGFPAQSDLASVTVVAENGLKADFLSTTLFIGGSAEVEKYIDADDFQILAVKQDGTILKSDALQFEVAS